MKSKILRDYQLNCFKKKFKLKNNNIILTVNNNKKISYYILDGSKKVYIDYDYAIFYF